jgi:hypothetical protein
MTRIPAILLGLCFALLLATSYLYGRIHETAATARAELRSMEAQLNSVSELCEAANL